ncbi:HEPN domain-containing protein, partial [Helicobacter pylori]|uniref:HEPN domain-containing protein n=1 Tax=Helicobacter pylori TaxID=210 RepID=UPI0003FB5A8B
MIRSLGGVGYVERQCFAFLKNPQIHHDQKEKIPGVFSYQENQISFSFVFLGEIEEIYSLFDDHIDPETIKGERFVCRTNYLESFFTTEKHLMSTALLKVGENGCESCHGDNGDNDKDFILQSFYIQNDFLSQKYEKDKIKARSNSLFSKRQHRLLTYQFDLLLECNIVFKNLKELALISEAIKSFFILIYAHSNFDIQIDYIQFKLSNKDITAVRNTYKKDKKSINIDPYGIAIRFQQIDHFSIILEKWIDFYIKNNRGFQLQSILDIINKKDPTIHYLDLFVLISMIEGFLKEQQRTKLCKKLSEFFKKSLSRTKCDQTKSYFNDRCQKDLIQQIVDYRNNLAHGDDLKLDTNKAADIIHAFRDLEQIVIEYFFGEIGLSDFITNNLVFSNKLH